MQSIIYCRARLPATAITTISADNMGCRKHARKRRRLEHARLGVCASDHFNSMFQSDWLVNTRILDPFFHHRKSVIKAVVLKSVCVRLAWSDRIGPVSGRILVISPHFSECVIFPESRSKLPNEAPPPLLTGPNPNFRASAGNRRPPRSIISVRQFSKV